MRQIAQVELTQTRFVTPLNKSPDCAVSNNSSENFIIMPLNYAT